MTGMQQVKSTGGYSNLKRPHYTPHSINSTYEISGHLYGHPETQKLMVLATGTKQISGNFDECVLNNNEIQTCVCVDLIKMLHLERYL